MGKILKREWESNIWMRILTISSIILIIASFFIPPLGIIDGSILAAVGELEAFGVLWILMYAIEKGTNASFKKGDVEVEIKEKEEEKENKADVVDV